MSLLLLVFLVAFLIWLLAPRRRRAEPDPDAMDQDELDEAEREVRDLGVEQRPEDGWEGDDWGPGAPKR